MTQPSLHDRRRDQDDKIRQKSGNILVGTVRKLLEIGYANGARLVYLTRLPMLFGRHRMNSQGLMTAIVTRTAKSVRRAATL